MAMVVKNNMSAVRTLNTLNTNSSALQKSLAKVSSGMKINSAQDDASGYAISERMRVQIRSLDQANQNTQNASSLMKTAEGAVSSTVEILKSLKEKAINAATDTNTDSDRATIQKEIDQYIDQIDDNALTTFNGKYLVDGSKATKGNDTFSKFTNQSLKVGTTGADALTTLSNRNGESLEIKSTDWVTASYVKDGKTTTVNYQVGDTTLSQIFEQLNTEGGGGVFAGASGGSSGGGSTNIGAASNLSAEKLAAIVSGDTTAGVTQADLQALQNVGQTAIDNAVTDAVTALKTDFEGKVKGATVADPSNSANTVALADLDSAGAVGDSAQVTVGAETVSATGATNSKKITQANLGTAADNVVDSAKTAADAANTTYAAAQTAINGKLNGVEIKIDDSSNTFNGYKTTVSADETKINALATAEVEKAAFDKLASDVAGGTGWNSILNPATPAGGATAAINTDATSETTPTQIVTPGTLIGLDAAGEKVNTADGTDGLTISSAEAGVKGQISGVTISISDAEGNVKKAANASLDAFKATIYAKNKSSDNSMTFQVGAAANQAITVGLNDMRSEALGLKGADGSKVSVATQDKANAAVNVFDNAIQKVLDQQATIGAIESRLEYTSQNLTTSSENVQAAESTIRDADMAKEMTNYTKNNVLLQAAQSMLAQANQNSSAVLSLLQ